MAGNAVAAVGSVHAGRRGRAARARGQRPCADAEMALQNARDVYARRGKVVSLWVVPSVAITASPSDEAGSVLRAGGRQGLPASAVLQGSARTQGLLSDTTSFEYLLRLGDDRLVLGHRLSEWCGHGPILEEDIALANIALDLIGQATLYLKLAGETEGRDETRTRSPTSARRSSIRNVQLVELPKGDFAFTIVRQFFFDVFSFSPSRAASEEHERRYRGHRGEGIQGSPVPCPPLERVGGAAGRRHRREPRSRAESSE